jgi:hypothetical protein
MEKTKMPCLELRRFETIYRTFLKMSDAERSRSLDFMISRFNQDLKQNKNGKKK